MGEINGERGAYTYANGSIHGSSKVWKLVLTGGPCGGKTTAQVCTVVSVHVCACMPVVLSIAPRSRSCFSLAIVVEGRPQLRYVLKCT
jgi:hypothetical protein